MYIYIHMPICIAKCDGRGSRCHTRVMHAKLLFHVFNTTPKLNLCMFSSEMAHTPCTLSSVHVEYPTIKFRGDGSHSGQVMARKHMAHCASEPLRTLLTRTSPPHLAQLPEPHLECCLDLWIPRLREGFRAGLQSGARLTESTCEGTPPVWTCQ